MKFSIEKEQLYTVFKLEEEKLKIMRMSDTAPEIFNESSNVHGDDDYATPIKDVKEDI